jgi:thioredoxin-like negative regulator of GroEL
VVWTVSTFSLSSFFTLNQKSHRTQFHLINVYAKYSFRFGTASLCLLLSCTRMKPDWDRLAEESHPSVFIADVNCSDEAELCEKNGVAGYPTIKVYKDGAEDKYNGPRGFEELKDYVDENLAVHCNVHDMASSSCSEKAQGYANKWKDKSKEDVEKEVKRLSGMLDKSMTRDLKVWLRERLNILKQYQAVA